MNLPNPQRARRRRKTCERVLPIAEPTLHKTARPLAELQTFHDNLVGPCRRGENEQSNVCLKVLRADRVGLAFRSGKTSFDDRLKRRISALSHEPVCAQPRAGTPLSSLRVAPDRVCSSAMERSRLATINLASSTSHAQMAQQIYLTQYGRMAEPPLLCSWMCWTLRNRSNARSDAVWGRPATRVILVT